MVFLLDIARRTHDGYVGHSPSDSRCFRRTHDGYVGHSPSDSRCFRRTHALHVQCMTQRFVSMGLGSHDTVLKK